MENKNKNDKNKNINHSFQYFYLCQYIKNSIWVCTVLVHTENDSARKIVDIDDEMDSVDDTAMVDCLVNTISFQLCSAQPSSLLPAYIHVLNVLI